MERSTAERNIGVTVNGKPKFTKHISEKVKRANSILGAMKRSFEHMDQDTFKKLFTALVRPHVEYANAVWSPSKKKDIDAVENGNERQPKWSPG